MCVFILYNQSVVCQFYDLCLSGHNKNDLVYTKSRNTTKTHNTPCCYLFNKNKAKMQRKPVETPNTQKMLRATLAVLALAVKVAKAIN